MAATEREKEAVYYVVETRWKERDCTEAHIHARWFSPTHTHALSLTILSLSHFPSPENDPSGYVSFVRSPFFPCFAFRFILAPQQEENIYHAFFALACPESTKERDREREREKEEERERVPICLHLRAENNRQLSGQQKIMPCSGFDGCLLALIFARYSQEKNILLLCEKRNAGLESRTISCMFVCSHCLDHQTNLLNLFSPFPPVPSEKVHKTSTTQRLMRGRWMFSWGIDSHVPQDVVCLSCLCAYFMWVIPVSPHSKKCVLFAFSLAISERGLREKKEKKAAVWYVNETWDHDAGSSDSSDSSSSSGSSCSGKNEHFLPPPHLLHMLMPLLLPFDSSTAFLLWEKSPLACLLIKNERWEIMTEQKLT